MGRISRNSQRVVRIQVALNNNYDSDDPGERVIDALADLRHYADELGLDYSDLDATADRHYITEVE